MSQDSSLFESVDLTQHFDNIVTEYVDTCYFLAQEDANNSFQSLLNVSDRKISEMITFNTTLLQHYQTLENYEICAKLKNLNDYLDHKKKL